MLWFGLGVEVIGFPAGAEGEGKGEGEGEGEGEGDGDPMASCVPWYSSTDCIGDDGSRMSCSLPVL